jgi:hypothetical protein
MDASDAPDPGNAKNLPPFIGSAPTEARVTRIRDVIVVPTTMVEGDYLAEEEQPAGEPPVELAEDMVLVDMPPADSGLVMNACTQRGHYFFAVRQFGERYTFVREVNPTVYAEGNRFGWDEEHRLFYTLALSRLIRDNGHSLEFAARLIDHEDEEQQVIPVRTPFIAGYRLRRDRDWLSATEAAELRHLFADYWPIRDGLPWKVSYAMNLAEDAVHLRVLQRALLLITTGLSGLVYSHRGQVTKQFVERLPLLADEVAIEGVDEQYAADLYQARSEAAHGAPVSMFQARAEEGKDDMEPGQPAGEPEPPEAEPDVAAPLALAQDLLRAAARRAIEDAEFRSIFESDESVAAKWPVQI